MAEILGIAASVVQFLDIAFRLSGKLGSLYSDLRDVPGKLHRLKLDIDQQITIAKYIQSSHATFWNDPLANSTAATPIDQTLADYMLDMEQLLGLLQSITSEDGAGPIRRSWDAIRAVHKRKDALLLCDNLEKKKSSILLWLCNTNTELSFKIKNLIEEVQINVDKTFQLTQRIEETSMKADQQLRQIPALRNLSNATNSAIAELTSTTISAQQQLLTATASTNAQVRTLLDQWQVLAPTVYISRPTELEVIEWLRCVLKFHEFRDILQSSPHLLQSIHQLSIASQDPSAHSGYKYAAGIQPSQNGVLAEDRFLSNKTTRKENSRPFNVCTCRNISKVTNIEPMSFLHFRKVFRRHHYRQCPKSKTSETSLEFLMKLIPPTWLLSHTIHLGFSLHYWNSKNSWKISPFVVGTARLVDSNKSPAFRAVQRIRLNLSETGIQTSHVRALERSLRDMVECHQASVFDEDGNGSTLLYEVLKVYIWRGHLPYDPAAAEFLSLIRFLIDSGSNPNVHHAKPTEGWLIEQGGTSLDMFATWLLCPKPIFRRVSPADSSVYTHLVDSGAHFSRPLASCIENHPTYYFSHFKQEVEQFETFEEQLEVCDMSDLMISIVQRTEADFTRALGKDDIHEVSRANGLAPIHFAIYWPWALQQLIEAGADVNCEDSVGRRPIHLAVACRQAAAVEILLQADCSIFTPDYSHSLLQESLDQGREFDHVTSWIIDALIDRHTRLRDLALSILPDDSNLRGQINRESISEIKAPEIIESLTRRNCPIPRSLEVDRDGEGVYDTADMHAMIRLTVPFADKLWQGGFHRVDEFAPINGLSPLLQSWFIADFDMVSWFIGKGSSPFSKHRDGSLSGLHLYAARIAYPGAHFGHDPKKVPISPQHWQQLTDYEDMWQDSCGCLCSINGCTPISTVIKHQWLRICEALKDNYIGMMEYLRIWQEKMLYQPERDPRHIQQLLEAIVFEKMNLRHTCCKIGQLGEVEAWDEYDIKGRIYYGSSGPKAEFRQLLDDYAIKMLRCQCATPEKPICVVFRKVCGTSSGQGSV